MTTRSVTVEAAVLAGGTSHVIWAGTVFEVLLIKSFAANNQGNAVGVLSLQVQGTAGWYSVYNLSVEPYQVGYADLWLAISEGVSVRVSAPTPGPWGVFVSGAILPGT